MKIKLIDFGYIVAPRREHYNDVGIDVFTKERIVIHPRSTEKVPLGFGLEIPDGYAGFIYPKSGLSAQGLTNELAPIDPGFKGEVHAIVTNHTETTQYIQARTKIGQLVVIPIVYPELVDFLGDERNLGAFGSTGL